MSEKKSSHDMDLPVVEGLNNGNDVDCVVSAGPGVGEDGDEDVLLEVERPRVQRERPAAGEGHLDGPLGERRRHELADGKDENLRRHGGDVDLVGSVGEELVDKPQDDT